MKLPSIIVLTLSTYHVYAFSVVRTIIPSTKSMNSSMKSTTTTSLRETSLFFAEETKTEEKEDINEEENMESMVGSSTSFESMSGSIYDRLGFQEEQIAIGIKPEDVLEWVGNRDDMIERFKKDNSGMDDERAQKEVDKFMMDAEMVNALVTYEQKKSRGEIEVEFDTPQFDLFTLFISGYLVYVVGSIVKRTIDRQNAAALLNDDATGQAADAVQGAIDAVQVTADVIQNTALDVVQGAM